MAGALDHGLHVVLPRDLRQLAQGLQLAELGRVVGIGDAARAQAITQREGHVVGLHDVADVLEVGVEEVLLVVRQAPLGHDRPAARDDAGHAAGGQRHVTQQHAGVDGEVVHALLGLFDERVAEEFPAELFGAAVHLLQHLVDRHGADRHRGVADDPLAGFVDVPAGGQVHHRVRAPADRPDQLLHLLGDARGHRGVADVGIDLGQEVAADDHRLAFRMVDVGRQDGAPACDLLAHELRGDGLRNVRAEALTRMLRQQAGIAHRLQPLVLADRHVLHLRSHDAAPGIVHLGDIGAGRGPAGQAPAGEAHRRQRRILCAVAARLRPPDRQRRRVAA